MFALATSPNAVLRRAQQLIELHEAERRATPEQLEARRMTLAQFTRHAWHVVERSPLVWNWHLDCVATHLQALVEGRLDKRNLLLLQPPGTMKSTLTSVMLTAWIWINRPWWRGIFAAGSESVGLRDSMRCRDIIASSWYQRTFAPSWRISDDQDAKGHYSNTAKGFRLTTTGEARIIGLRADGLFADDLLDSNDAYSEARRKSLRIWWDETFYSRIASPQRSTRCLIMQRLHELDPAGHILANYGNEWECVELPQLFEPWRRFTSSIGWSDPRVLEGEPLFPQRFDAGFIVSERHRLGDSAFSGQHQQRPSAAQGEIFKRGFLQFLPRLAPITFSRVIQSWDPAVKVAAHNDPSAGLMIGEFEKGYLIMDRRVARMAYPELKESARVWAQSSPISALLIEDTSSGQQLIQEFTASTALPVVPVKKTSDKIVYANICVPTWESGRIYVYGDCPWVEDFLAELCAFPNGSHDDQVDAFTQAIIYLMQRPPGAGIVDWYTRQVTPTAPSLTPDGQPQATKHPQLSMVAVAQRRGAVVTPL